MNVTRAVLPVMRKQRSGLIITISSTAGLIGFEFGTAYAASKFGLEGWMQSLQAEVETFGINTITVNPCWEGNLGQTVGCWSRIFLMGKGAPSCETSVQTDVLLWRFSPLVGVIKPRPFGTTNDADH